MDYIKLRKEFKEVLSKIGEAEIESWLKFDEERMMSSSADTGGINKYFEDLENWENSFYCNECGCDKMTDFAYDRTVANGEVWHCKHCKTETVAGNEPNEDRY